MRALSLALIFALSSLQAEEKAPVDRNAAYERVRDTEKLGMLIERAGTNISDGKSEAALADATLAVELEPENPSALNAKAAALIDLQRYDEATPLLEEALRNDPDHFPALFNRAEVLLLQRKYSDAAVEFRMLYSKFPNNPLVKFKVYLSYHLAGRDDIAHDVLNSLRFTFDGPAWYYAQAASKFIANDPRGARKLIRTAKAIHPEDAGRYEEALEEAGLLK